MYVALNPQIPSHVPPPAVAGPYTVCRERVVFEVPTVTTSGKDFVSIFGRWRTTTETSDTAGVSKLYGLEQAPPDGTTTYALAAISNSISASGSSRARLHALSISVRCTGTTAGTIPGGFLAIGSLNNMPFRTANMTGLALKDYILSQSSVKIISAYEAMQRDITRFAFPMDHISWQEFDSFFGPNATGDCLSDALSPIVLYISNAETAKWMVTVRAEWCFIFGGTANYLLSQTSAHHTPSSSSVWSRISRDASDLGGDLESLVGSSISRLSSLAAPVELAAERFGSAIGRASRSIR